MKHQKTQKDHRRDPDANHRRAGKTGTMVLFLSLLVLGLMPGSAVPTGRGPLQEQMPVLSLVRTLEVGKALSHGNLTIIPVYMDKVLDRTDYVTLEEALKRNWIEIVELEGGRVPQVKISNLSKSPVYLMGGEILTGCKQDRIMTRDLLLGAGTRDLIVPVFCVEHGRWTRTSSRFYSKENVGTYSMRKTAQAREQGAQSEIWAKVAEQNQKTGVDSPTSAYQDAYDKSENRAKIEAIEKELGRIPLLHKDTVGVVIGLGGEIIGTDIFANPQLFRKQWPKILRSSALTSLGHGERGQVSQKDAARFLKSFGSKRYRMEKGLDLGIEYSTADSEVFLNSLAYKQKVLHLAAFPQEKKRIKVWEEGHGERRVIRENYQTQPQITTDSQVQEKIKETDPVSK